MGNPKAAYNRARRQAESTERAQEQPLPRVSAPRPCQLLALLQANAAVMAKPQSSTERDPNIIESEVREDKGVVIKDASSQSDFYQDEQTQAPQPINLSRSEMMSSEKAKCEKCLAVKTCIFQTITRRHICSACLLVNRGSRHTLVDHNLAAQPPSTSTLDGCLQLRHVDDGSRRETQSIGSGDRIEPRRSRRRTSQDQQPGDQGYPEAAGKSKDLPITTAGGASTIDAGFPLG